MRIIRFVLSFEIGNSLRVPRTQISADKDCHGATFQPLFFRYRWTYQRPFYHLLQLFCGAAPDAHLSQNLFLSMKVSIIGPLLDFRTEEILVQMDKPATWHRHIALIEAMLYAFHEIASFFTLNHHDWLLVMYSFTCHSVNTLNS